MEKSNLINITVTGDFCPINRVQDLCLSDNYGDIFGDVLPVLHKSDLSITNLECPLTEELSPISKVGPNLAASPECIDLLKLAQIDVVTLANNHIMDHGVAGLVGTLQVCSESDIKTVGAGSNIENARRILYVDINHQKIAIINCCETEFNIAGQESHGANPLDPVQLFYAVQKARKVTDTILVIVHGGHEIYEYPSVRMVDTYRFIADLGVTAVIGHHTHCASGYEWWNGVPIVYSLGNFLFDWPGASIKGWETGLLLELNIQDGKVTELIINPFYQCKNKLGLELMKGTERDEVLDRIKEISNTIADRNKLEQQWNKFSKEKRMEFLPHLLTMGKYERYLFKNGLDVFKRTNKKKLLRLLNFIQCEAHRDISIAVLREWVKRDR